MLNGDVFTHHDIARAKRLTGMRDIRVLGVWGNGDTTKFYIMCMKMHFTRIRTSAHTLVHTFTCTLSQH